MGGGFLTGKIDQLGEDYFRLNNPKYAGDNLKINQDRFAPLMKLANKLHIAPSQLALAWLLSQGDRARIGGHKKVRARLYREAGFDAIDKMAACDSEQMRKTLADFIKKTGFRGTPPTPGEAKNSVPMAKYIKRLKV